MQCRFKWHFNMSFISRRQAYGPLTIRKWFVALWKWQDTIQKKMIVIIFWDQDGIFNILLFTPLYFYNPMKIKHQFQLHKLAIVVRMCSGFELGPQDGRCKYDPLVHHNLFNILKLFRTFFLNNFILHFRDFQQLS